MLTVVLMEGVAHVVTLMAVIAKNLINIRRS
jgi:hypothetical protein